MAKLVPHVITSLLDGVRPRLSRASKLVDWLTTGLRRTVDWYRSQRSATQNGMSCRESP